VEALDRAACGVRHFVRLVLVARENHELAVAPQLAGLRPHDLSRGGLGNAARRHEQDGVRIDVAVPADRPRQLLAVRQRIRVAHLCDDDKRFLLLVLDRERRNAASADLLCGTLDRGLDVRGVTVDAADDDEVLDPAVDEQFVLV